MKLSKRFSLAKKTGQPRIFFDHWLQRWNIVYPNGKLEFYNSKRG